LTDHYLKHPEYFRITDEKTGRSYTGGDQKWYGRFFRRLAGCGPVAASNIFKYFSAEKLTGGSASGFYTLKEYRKLMNELWNHVTPTSQGVNNTKIFYSGCMSYAESKGFRIEYKYIDVSGISEPRPSLEKINKFISASLDNDLPAAFLSLDSGEELRIDKWHWMTVIGLHDKTAGSSSPDDPDPENTVPEINIDFLDEGRIKHADLSKWYSTTGSGGGFVSVSPVSE